MNNWQEVYKVDANNALMKLKQKVSSNTYNNIMTLYNKFKDKIR